MKVKKLFAYAQQGAGKGDKLASAALKWEIRYLL